MFAGRMFSTNAVPDVTSGTLTIATEPTGAQVIVDGEPRGLTPVTSTLPPGPHRVELVGEGEPRSIPVTITAGMQVSQYIELARAGAQKGQLQVRTEPAGARVTIDGELRGTSPTTVADLAPGEHIVVLRERTARSSRSSTSSPAAPLRWSSLLLPPRRRPRARRFPVGSR